MYTLQSMCLIGIEKKFENGVDANCKFGYYFLNQETLAIAESSLLDRWLVYTTVAKEQHMAHGTGLSSLVSPTNHIIKLSFIFIYTRGGLVGGESRPLQNRQFDDSL